MKSSKPEKDLERLKELPEERLQWVVPDRGSKSPNAPRPWQPLSDISVTFPDKGRSRLH